MNKSKPKWLTVIIVILVLGVLGLIPALFIKNEPITSDKLTQGVMPFIQNKEAVSGGELPPQPKFVLYDMDSNTVYIPDTDMYRNGTDDPEEVNVIVAYRQKMVKGRFYYYSQADKNYHYVYSRDLEVSVIQKDGWKLIVKRTFEENGGVDEPTPINWKNKLQSEASEFINSVMDGSFKPYADVMESPTELPMTDSQ